MNDSTVYVATAQKRLTVNPVLYTSFHSIIRKMFETAYFITISPWLEKQYLRVGGPATD